MPLLCLIRNYLWSKFQENRAILRGKRAQNPPLPQKQNKTKKQKTTTATATTKQQQQHQQQKQFMDAASNMKTFENL